MSILFFVVLAFGVFVTWSHIHGLTVGLRLQHASENVRQRAWRLHMWKNGTLWVVLFLLLVMIEWTFVPHNIPIMLRVLGTILFLVGIIVCVWSRLLLGRDQAMGVRFYFPERLRPVTEGPYRYLKNPMYVGFILLFLGIGLMTGIEENFLFALATFLLLYVWLAKVENAGLQTHSTDILDRHRS